MPSQKKATAKPSVTFKDLKSKKNPKGGGDVALEIVGRPQSGAGELKSK
jgi:hypothetical protein